MARPSQAEEQSRMLLPIVCEVFSELGYRRTTTAVLAKRCKVRENILYRLWPDKKAMFLASIDYIFRSREKRWTRVLEKSGGSGDSLRRIIEHESHHQGDSGFYRIVFTALSETDDEEIRKALAEMYHRFHRLVCAQIETRDTEHHTKPELPAEIAAWGLLGLATVSNIIRELKLLSAGQRERVFLAVAGCLTGGQNS